MDPLDTLWRMPDIGTSTDVLDWEPVDMNDGPQGRRAEPGLRGAPDQPVPPAANEPGGALNTPQGPPPPANTENAAVGVPAPAAPLPPLPPNSSQIMESESWKKADPEFRAHAVNQWAIQSKAARSWTPEQTEILNSSIDAFHEAAGRTWGEAAMDVASGIPAALRSLPALPFGALQAVGGAAAEGTSWVTGKSLGLSNDDVNEIGEEYGTDFNLLLNDSLRLGNWAQTLANKVLPGASERERLSAEFDLIFDGLRQQTLSGMLPSDPDELYDSLLEVSRALAVRAGGTYGDNGMTYLSPIMRGQAQPRQEQASREWFKKALAGELDRDWRDVPDDTRELDEDQNRAGVWNWRNQSRSLVESPENLALLMEVAVSRDPAAWKALRDRLKRSRVEQYAANSEARTEGRRRDGFTVPERMMRFFTTPFGENAQDTMTREVRGLSSSPVDMLTTIFSWGLGRSALNMARAGRGGAAAKEIGKGAATEFAQGFLSGATENPLLDLGAQFESGLTEAVGGMAISGAGAAYQGTRDALRRNPANPGEPADPAAQAPPPPDAPPNPGMPGEPATGPASATASEPATSNPPPATAAGDPAEGEPTYTPPPPTDPARTMAGIAQDGGRTPVQPEQTTAEGVPSEPATSNQQPATAEGATQQQPDVSEPQAQTQGQEAQGPQVTQQADPAQQTAPPQGDTTPAGEPQAQAVPATAVQPEQMAPEESAALKITKLKKVEHRGNGIHFVPDFVMTAKRRAALIAEDQKGKFGVRPRGGRFIEVKPWADVTGVPGDKGWAIIDRRAARAFRDNSPVAVESVDGYGIKPPPGYVKQGDLYVYQPDATDAPQATPDPATTATINQRNAIESEGGRIEVQPAPAAVQPAATPAPSPVPSPVRPVDTSTTPDATTTPVTETKSGVQDVGETLDVRKNRQPSLEKDLTEADIASQPLSKIWPKSEVEGIQDKQLAALAHAVRDSIPAKPRSQWKLNRWAMNVREVRKLMQTAERSGVETTLAAMEAESTSSSMKSLAARTRVLGQIPRQHWNRVEAVENHPDAYTYKRNEEGLPVERIPAPYADASFDGRHVKASSLTALVEDLQTRLANETNPQTPAQRKAKPLKFEVRRRSQDGKYFINKKGDPLYRPLVTFDTSAEALAYRKESPNELTTAWENLKEQENVKQTDVRNPENRPRTGKDWRQGQDITAETFQQTFGFRGITFGNWVAQGKNAKERQGMLNLAYDSFMDLATILDVPPQAISLNGSLGMAFGAAGSGKFAAHYNPNDIHINLTKTRGAGSLAHEWFHAADHYFQRQRSVQNRFLDQGPFITFQPEPSYRHKDTGQVISKTRYDMMARGSQELVQGYEPIKGVRPEVEARFAELVKALDSSPMSRRAIRMDKGKSGYWSRIIERAARSFENYIIDKMMKDGFNNDYLANVTTLEDFQRSESAYPYLKPDEIAPVAEAFDNLFGTIQTRQTDKGVAMFSQPRDPAPPPPVTPQQDADYLAAVERGDMQSAHRMVDAVARAAGYTDRVYHGTPEGQKFSVFGNRGALTGAASALKAFFFTGAKSVADTYRMQNRPDPDRAAIQNWVDSVSDSDLWKLAPRNVNGITKSLGPDTMREDIVEVASTDFINEAGEDIYYALDDIVAYAKMNGVAVPPSLENSAVGQTYSVFLKSSNPLSFTEADVDALGMDGVMQKAIDGGHDSAVSSEPLPDSFSGMDNKNPPSGIIYAVFNSNQIKSADPVTYDNAGNPIPLSQRFDQSSPDIRFSQRTTLGQKIPNPLRTVKAAIDILAQRWPGINSGRVSVFQNAAAFLATNYSRNTPFTPAEIAAMQTAEGFFDPLTGRTILFADQIEIRPGETAGSAIARVVIHERIGHEGIHALMQADPQFDAKVQALIQQIPDAALNEIAAEAAYAHIAGDRAALAFEWLARQAEIIEGAGTQGGLKGIANQLWQALTTAISRLFRDYSRAAATRAEVAEILTLARGAVLAGDALPTGIPGAAVQMALAYAQPRAIRTGTTRIFHRAAGPFRVRNLTWRAMLTGSPLPKAFVAAAEATQREAAALNQRGTQIGRDMHRQVQDLLKADPTRTEADVYMAVADAMDGLPGAFLRLEAINQQLADTTRAARNFIDQLSDAIAQTLPNGDLRNTIVGNLGNWLRRSYAVFDANSGWNYDNLEAAARKGEQHAGKDARQIMRDAIKLIVQNDPALATDVDPLGLAAPDTALEADLRELLDRDTLGQNFTGGGKVRKNVSSLIHRKTIDKAIRDLLGEQQNPLARFAQSAQFAAGFLTRHQQQMTMAQIGLDQKLFSTDRRGTYTVQIPSDHAWSGMAGLWTTPELFAALQKSQVQGDLIAGKLGETIKAMSAIGKLNKVANNPDSWMVNLLGNPAALLMSGDPFYLSFFSKSPQGGINFQVPAFFRRFNEATRIQRSGRVKRADIDAGTSALIDAYRGMAAKLTASGVLGQTVTFQDLQASLPKHLLGFIEQHSGWNRVTGALRGGYEAGAMAAGFGVAGRVVGGVVGGAAGAVVGFDRMHKVNMKLAHILMTVPDAQAKIIGYLRNYEVALKAGLDPDAANARATERTRNTFPDYSKIPKAVREFSRYGVLNTFVSFQYEVYRNFAWNIRYMAQDLASKDKTMVLDGLARLGGISAITYLTATGLQAFLSEVAGDDTDEKDKAFRRWFAAPWEQFAALAFNGYNEEGVSYFNTGYLLPTMTLKELYIAAASGEDPGEIAGNLVASVWRQFVEGSVNLDPILQAASGRNAFDDKISHRTGAGQVIDRLEHVSKTVFTPGWADKLQRITYAMRDAERRGRTFSLREEALRFVGVRQMTRTWPQLAQRGYRNLADEYSRIRNQANDVLGTNHPGAQRRAIEQANRDIEALIERRNRYEQDMRVMQIPERIINNARRDSSIPRRFNLLQVDPTTVGKPGRSPRVRPSRGATVVDWVP